MADLVVELHVPLVPTPGLPGGEYQYPWILETQEATMALDREVDGAEDYDDGEEWGEHYIFFLTGDDESRVIEAASAVARANRLPSGAFLLVTDTDAPEFGLGRREELR